MDNCRHLVDQFSISRGGGIYYNGTKFTPTKDPILVVGLGGTGIDAMLRIKNEVQRRMMPEIDSNGKILSPVPGNMAFLAVDTDRNALKKAVGIATITESMDEFVDLRVDGLKNVVATIVSAHLNEPEWDWYDPELKTGDGADGACGIRQIGRLMLFLNYQKVFAQFRSVLHSISSKSQLYSSRLKVFILTGIGGGTGSGTFLDIAYLLCCLGHEITPNVQMNGYIFTPDLNKANGDDTAYMYCNGFAALKELDYWMSSAEHGKHFIQRYPGNFLIDEIDRPYDFCHIIMAQDADHRILTYSDAMKAVADVLFNYFTSESDVIPQANNVLTSRYYTIMPYISVAYANAKHPANYRYLSVGSSAIEIPYREIMTLLAARMFEKLDPVFRRIPDNQSFQQDLMHVQLTYQHLWNDIHQNIGGDPLGGGKQFTYSEIVPNNAPYAKVYQWLNGYAHQELAKNGHNLQSIKEGAFTDYMRTLIRAPQRGPGYASRMLYSNEGPNLINTMEAFRQDSQDRAATAAAKNGMLKSQLEQAFIGVNKSGLFGRSNAVKAYNEALREWKENDYAYWAYTELAEGLLTLIERLKKYREKVFHPLLSAISVLPGIFADNVTAISVSDQAIQQDPQQKDRYLILATEFERRHYERVQQDAVNAATKFLQELGENLKKWVGVELNEIDSVILEPADIPSFVSDLVNESFSEVVSSDNLSVEGLLLEKAPVGVDKDDYIRSVTRKLRDAAVPMFHMEVAAGILVNPERFALISIPDNCPTLSNSKIDRGFVTNETPRITAERSKIQWVSIMAGMPLFVSPEVTYMEAHYARMVGTEATRKGVHLRYEWRDIMPSPLPESTWPQAIRNEPQKKFDRDRNAKIREAYQLCRKEGIIVKATDVNPSDTTRDRYLFVADESKLNNLASLDCVSPKQQSLQSLRRTLWSDPNTAIRLRAFGGHTFWTEDDNVCENVLRFYDICEQIMHQAQLLDLFRTHMAQLDSEALHKQTSATE